MMMAALGAVNAGTDIALIAQPASGAGTNGLKANYQLDGNYWVESGTFYMKMDLTCPLQTSNNKPVYQLYLQFTDQVASTSASTKWDYGTCDLIFTTQATLNEIVAPTANDFYSKDAQ